MITHVTSITAGAQGIAAAGATPSTASTGIRSSPSGAATTALWCPRPATDPDRWPVHGSPPTTAPRRRRRRGGSTSVRVGARRAGRNLPGLQVVEVEALGLRREAARGHHAGRRRGRQQRHQPPGQDEVPEVVRAEHELVTVPGLPARRVVERDAGVVDHRVEAFDTWPMDRRRPRRTTDIPRTRCWPPRRRHPVQPRPHLPGAAALTAGQSRYTRMNSP